MRPAARALTVVFAVCAAALIVVLVLPSVSPVSGPNTDDADLAFQPHPGARLPLGVKLVDEAGATVPLGDYFNKAPVILVLEYPRCRSLCGVTLRNLVTGALNELPLQAGRDYQLVAVSIDPRDKPADAAAARAKYAGLLDRGGESGLHFLTAVPQAVRKIADIVGFRYRYDSFLDAYIHPAGFVIAAPNGMISRYVEGIAVAPQELVDALADAQQDKSQGLLARIFLLCHVQGAALGRFTVPVMAALTLANIAAGLTLITLFTVIRRQG
jgi:protein SCO1